MEVKVKKNNVEYALRLLKRKIKDSGLMVELRERQYYKKPSEKRREKYFQRLATIEKIKRKERQQRDD